MDWTPQIPRIEFDEARIGANYCWLEPFFWSTSLTLCYVCAILTSEEATNNAFYFAIITGGLVDFDSMSFTVDPLTSIFVFYFDENVTLQIEGIKALGCIQKKVKVNLGVCRLNQSPKAPEQVRSKYIAVHNVI